MFKQRAIDMQGIRYRTGWQTLPATERFERSFSGLPRLKAVVCDQLGDMLCELFADFIMCS
jgi:hypothetical protein